MKQRGLIIVSIPLALYSEFLFPVHAGHRHQESQRKETRELKQGLELEGEELESTASSLPGQQFCLRCD